MNFKRLFVLVFIVFSSTASLSVKVYASKEIPQENAFSGEYLEDSYEDFPDEDFEGENNYSDPIAPLNKFVFGINKIVDTIVIKPVALTYKFIIPSFGREAVGNALSNLKEPINFFNSLLQFEGKKAGRTLGRFIVNTVFGLGGLIDVATRMGIEHQPNDFGITLARWGFGEGFYLVLPVLGPSNLRDAIGKVGDFFMDPFNWYVYCSDNESLGYARTGLTVVDTRLSVLDITNSLDKTADPYNNYRITFTDNRRFVVNKHKGIHGEQIKINED